ncbi:WD40 repeat domain-containing protein [Gimesia fumaroli]|uniref:Uncharacterized protein n=1 Tax=Gimesia fumaroli TaxID=2527976 RepID=A0A518I5S5_9PLAN|nr:WD40 repeat domain-containing protein [Gimesia fumaroli]QDV48442.1 hypothetical protein Enr17x_04540 [Gimesia fumaroli]
MVANILGFHFVSNITFKVSICLLLLLITKPVSAIEARKPEVSLADLILMEKKIHREQFYGDVRLLHSPNPMNILFSADGTVLFSLAETVRLWQSDTGEYLGSIAGPARFRQFALLNNSRWIVTIDDLEEPWLSNGLYIIPQVVPHLRIWDVTKGTCLGIRRLKIPVNSTKIWFPAIETANQLQMTFLIVHYDDDSPNTQRKLVGYHGRNLVPILEFALEDEFDSLTWDPHTRQLYLYNDYKFASYDPASNKIVWTSNRNIFNLTDIKIEQLIVIDQPLQFKEKMSGHKKLASSILLTFEPELTQGFDKDILLQWGLVNPLSGNPIKSGFVTRNFRPIDKQTNKGKAENLIYWFRDDNDHSIRAVNILKNQLLLKIPCDHDEVVSTSRYKAGLQKWYLEREDYRAEADKILWSRAANRICSIRGLMEEIKLFDSSTGKPVASASGTVNALSNILAGRISASFDWNNISVFEFNADKNFMNIFNTKVLQNSCVALSSDASNLLVGETSGYAHLWNLPKHEKIATLAGGTNKLLGLGANTAQKIIISCDNTGTFRWWKLPTQLSEIQGRVQTLKAERNNKPTVPSLSFYKKLRSSYHLPNSLCDMSTDALHALSFKPFSPLTESMDGELWLVPGDSLIAKINENPVEGGFASLEPKLGVIIFTEVGKNPKRLTPAVHEESILLQIKLSTDGRFALFVFDTGQVTIVNLQEGVLESIIQTNNREIVDVNYHHKRKTLLVASYRGTIRTWNSETFLKTGSLQIQDARLEFLSSRVAKIGFDLVLGTWDTGLIVKCGTFPKSEQKPQRPVGLTFPFE